MIIDCHGHFTTVPTSFRDWRAKQVEFANDPANAPSRAGAHVTDDEIREGVGNGQLKLQRERGSDLTLFSPIAGLMSHHLGNERTSLEWAEVSNDLVHRVTELYPDNFAPVCQLPQSPGVAPANSIPELRRCVEEMGFVGCNLNPDPTGGYWTGKPMTDREWYPLYEALVDLDVPAMIHVAASCNPCFHGTGAHYLNADTSVFMQVLQSDLFKDFPTLRFVIPHGGGAVPYHWGRYQGHVAGNVRSPARRLAEQHLLRLLRLSPAGRRAADQGRADRQRAVRIGNGGRRARQGSGHRPIFRRYQALHRRVYRADG